jgi:hypothetical protein
MDTAKKAGQFVFTRAVICTFPRGGEDGVAVPEALETGD